MRPHASPHLTQSDHTIELLDERGAVAGALSIEISGVAAMCQLLQSVRGPLAPPPPLAERPAHGGGGEQLLLLACGELQVWPEASLSAARLRAGESLFLALELAMGDSGEGGQHESASVRLRRDRTARFDAHLSLRMLPGSAARRALCAALSPTACEQHADSALLGSSTARHPWPPGAGTAWPWGRPALGRGAAVLLRAQWEAEAKAEPRAKALGQG